MTLRLLVTVKRVEDPESKIAVRPDGASIVTDGVSYRTNPFDEIAVEEALRLREAHGGEVVVVSIGTSEAVSELRAALAMGADRALLVSHGGPLDPFIVSNILGAIAREEKPDLVLLGKQSVDDDQNQVGQYLAVRLGLAQATFASKEDGLESDAEQTKRPGLVLGADGKKVTVAREVDGGVETLELQLPAVVTVDLRLNKPRFASLPGIMKAKKKPVREIAAASLGVDLAPKVIVKRLAEPPRRTGGALVPDVATLYQKLHVDSKVL
jgi:electron transfer flavoprotein beta subunit